MLIEAYRTEGRDLHAPTSSPTTPISPSSSSASTWRASSPGARTTTPRRSDFAYAPRDYEDALDSYRRTLEIVGDIAGDFVAPRAEDVDREAASLVDGEVCYAPGISEALERLRQADLMGITLPRRTAASTSPSPCR